MLITVTTTRRPATDLGFLLHKHPEGAQSFELPVGTTSPAPASRTMSIVSSSPCVWPDGNSLPTGG